jgi:hypothetical protein
METHKEVISIKTKSTLICLATLALEGFLTWIIAFAMGIAFAEITFFTGLLFTVLFYYFNTLGGFTTTLVNLHVQSSTGIRAENEKTSLRSSPVMIGSLIYLILSAGLTVMVYWHYFT